MALGQTDAGRYLTVLFIYKETREALILSARDMAKSNSDEMPFPESLDALVEFFDNHDMGDYWEQLPEAHFDVDITVTKRLVAIDGDILNKLNQLAKSRQISAEALINNLLRERVG